MPYQHESNVISLGDTKQAALYFDRVIIVDPAEQMGIYGLPEFGKGAYNLISNNKITQEDLLNYNNLFQEYRQTVELPGFSFSRVENSDNFISNTRKKLIEGYINDDTLPNGNTIRNALNNFAAQLGINNYSVLLPSRYSDTSSTPATDDDLTLTLSNIQLINTDKTSWQQILELRKDTDSLKKLRNLKLFMQSNYQGKGKEFIEDDFAKRSDDYNNMCKDHGLETCISAFSVILDAKHLQTAIAGGVAATLLGGPITGLGAAACLELGHISLEVAKRKYAFSKLKRDHELAYIIDAKERIEG